MSPANIDPTTLDKEKQELSPSRDGPHFLGQEKDFLEKALLAAYDQQKLLRCDQGSMGIDSSTLDALMGTVIKQGLSMEEVEERVCNCFCWLWSQHWVKERPYPKGLGAALHHHLKGEYPYAPNADKTDPDCLEEEIGYVSFIEGYFLVSSDCAFKEAGESERFEGGLAELMKDFSLVGVVGYGSDIEKARQEIL